MEDTDKAAGNTITRNMYSTSGNMASRSTSGNMALENVPSTSEGTSSVKTPFNTSKDRIMCVACLWLQVVEHV